ncbi:MAG: hypothetical protein IKB98_06060 [Clostridia bacterium]|nr:hypothetical protein [Clostridia bacterium]
MNKYRKSKLENEGLTKHKKTLSGLASIVLTILLTPIVVMFKLTNKYY